MKSARCTPSLERLETRDNTAADVVSANLTAGILTIEGSPYNDSIGMSTSNGRCWVQGSSLVSGTYRYFANNYPLTSISSVVVVAGTGNDTIAPSWSFALPCRSYGGPGRDLIYGGSKNDILYGGDENDTLHGRPGADILFGGSGIDSLNDFDAGTTKIEGPSYSGHAPSSLEQQVLTLVNSHRAANGLVALTWNSQLGGAAKLHSTNMALRSNVIGDNAAMQHVLYGTTTPDAQSRLEYVGYDRWSRYGENIAYGYATAQAVVTAWMNSPGHRANILNANFREIGISAVANARGTLFWTQEFGRRF